MNGATWQGNEWSFRLWAPKVQTVSILMNEELYPMKQLSPGIFSLTLPDGPLMGDYLYCLNGDKRRPDPTSRWQPNGVHAPSRLYRHDTYQWHDAHWRGMPLNHYVCYELHVGTFTPAGTFAGVIERLPDLKALGVTAIELMPVATFPGRRNWGYDGVYLYAPHEAYGGPDGLKALIDACHQQEMAVILDVVYNHLGPEGNYLNEFGFYFTDRYRTPWGYAINYDGPHSDPVRDFVVGNVLYWLREFHVDALRLDAVHALYDFGAHHILQEIEEAVRHYAQESGRQCFTIAESDLNDVRILHRPERGGYGLDAQWNEDFHHAAHAWLTGDRSRYFVDFGTLHQLAIAIREGFVYQGQWSSFRQKRFGSSSKDILPSQLITYLQNHDQVGNACEGRRLGHLVSPADYYVMTTLFLLVPSIPLLFMGQEWNASTPFYFFTDYADVALARAVKEGYQKEWQLTDETIDPQDPHRHSHSILQWHEREEGEHAKTLSLYRALLQLRRERLQESFSHLSTLAYDEGGRWLSLQWGNSSTPLHSFLVANFGPLQEITLKIPSGRWHCLFSTPGAAPLPHLLVGESPYSLLVEEKQAYFFSVSF